MSTPPPLPRLNEKRRSASLHQGGADPVDPVAEDVVRSGIGGLLGDFAGLVGVGVDAAVAVGATVVDASCAGASLVADTATATDLPPPADDPHPAATNQTPQANTATVNAILRVRTPPPR